MNVNINTKKVPNLFSITFVALVAFGLGYVVYNLIAILCLSC